MYFSTTISFYVYEMLNITRYWRSSLGADWRISQCLNFKSFRNENIKCPLVIPLDKSVCLSCVFNLENISRVELWPLTLIPALSHLSSLSSWAGSERGGRLRQRPHAVRVQRVLWMSVPHWHRTFLHTWEHRVPAAEPRHRVHEEGRRSFYFSYIQLWMNEEVHGRLLVLSSG